MPDYFVPMDTMKYTKYHRALAAKGSIIQTSLHYLDENRSKLLAEYKDIEAFEKGFKVNDNLMQMLRAQGEKDNVKLEGGEEVIGTVKRIISAGIPVMGHLGLMPQSINKYGTYTVRAKDEAEAQKLIQDAHLLEEAGCFAIVLEKIPADLATRVASELTIPVIGIGAGGGVDGQVLVAQDMLGMNNGFRPRFLRRYADLHTVITDAVSRYVSDIKNLDFPNEKEQY
jgi:3-methyl-2-oxobutanoate hydroxymethyltransferase